MVQVNAKIEINFMLEPNIVKIQQMSLWALHYRKYELDFVICQNMFG
jgi:hypothetical protein